MGEGLDDEFGHSFVALRLDGTSAVGEGLLDEGDDVGFGLVLITFGVFASRWLLSDHRIGEVVVGSGGVEKLVGEAALGGRGFEIVFVFGEIFGHGDELAAYVVP